MNCLADKLETVGASELLWLAPGGDAIDRGRLAAALGTVDAEAWRGKRVALGAMPVVEFVATLTFLDGLAEAILLLPSEETAEAQVQRLSEARIDAVLDSTGLGFAQRLQALAPARSDASSTARPAPLPTTWLLPTSGTTGVPKLIAHTFATLTRSMAERAPSAQNYRWGSLYSLRRFAGLQVFLQSWMGGTPLILTDEGANVTELLARFVELGCNALSATPSMWRKLAMHPLFARLQLRQVTLGGEIVDQAVLDLLARRFPAARITHIYASTEAGVGFAVRDGRAGFPVSYLALPPAGVALRIDTQQHLCFDIDGTWLDSGDVVRVEGDRVFFLGRANGSINVGGNKVMPEEVELVIKELPDVLFVQVRARKSTVLGNLVEAAVIATPDVVFDAAFKKKISSHCRARLDAFKVPAFVVQADEFALTASGKLARNSAS
ncbi:MAG: acyl--CoA ligase [Burkholderiales bacterium]|nr:acyl--CoA ligase [Burkholderiales bacterium]